MFKDNVWIPIESLPESMPKKKKKVCQNLHDHSLHCYPLILPKGGPKPEKLQQTTIDFTK